MRATIRTLIVGVGIAVLGLTFAGTASAQGVSVIDEATGLDCDPCAVHLVGESHIANTTTGIEVSVCQDELFATLQADGTGAIDWVGTPEGGVGCIVTNCTVIPTEAHWPVTSLTETAPGLERIQLRLCYRGAGIEVHCNVSIPISHSESHRQTFTMVSLCFNGTRRVEATWQTESAQIELVHTEG